jgi:deoxycytidylate deaminase
MRTWAANLSIRIAQKSKFNPHKHGAVIVKGGKLVSVAVNSPKPMIPHDSCSIHAEGAAIKRAREVLDGAEIYVARVHNGEVGCSKPCKKCQAALIKAGIRKVYYSTNEGTWESYAN